MILERLSRGMQIKHVRESVDDAELVKEIEELKERIKNKTKELKVYLKIQQLLLAIVEDGVILYGIMAKHLH